MPRLFAARALPFGSVPTCGLGQAACCRVLLTRASSTAQGFSHQHSPRRHRLGSLGAPQSGASARQSGGQLRRLCNEDACSQQMQLAALRQAAVLRRGPRSCGVAPRRSPRSQPSSRSRSRTWRAAAPRPHRPRRPATCPRCRARTRRASAATRSRTGRRGPWIQAVTRGRHRAPHARLLDTQQHQRHQRWHRQARRACPRGLRATMRWRGSPKTTQFGTAKLTIRRQRKRTRQMVGKRQWPRRRRPPQRVHQMRQ